MSLYRRPNSKTWWYDFTWKGRRHRASTGTESKAEARQVEAAALTEAKRATAQPDRWRVRHLFGAYWEGRAQHAANAKTLKGQLAALSDGLGPNTYVTDISADMIVRYLAQRRIGRVRKVEGKEVAAVRSNATLNRELQALRAAMNFAADAHGQTVPRIAWKKLRLKEPDERVRHLRQEEFARLLASATDPEMACMIVLAIGSALRKQNLRTLTWEQVDLLTGRLGPIVTKGGKNFEVRLSGDPLERLRLHAAAVTKAKGKLEGPLFTLPNFRKRWERTRAAAGIANYRWHDHRHTFGAWMRIAGVDLASIRDAMNHSSIAMTTRYTHITAEEATTAWDVMGQRLASKAPSTKAPE